MLIATFCVVKLLITYGHFRAFFFRFNSASTLFSIQNNEVVEVVSSRTKAPFSVYLKLIIFLLCLFGQRASVFLK